jgi:hypothetical protein
MYEHCFYFIQSVVKWKGNVEFLFFGSPGEGVKVAWQLGQISPLIRSCAEILCAESVQQQQQQQQQQRGPMVPRCWLHCVFSHFGLSSSIC